MEGAPFRGRSFGGGIMGGTRANDVAALWAKKGSYSPRPGNEIGILIDGQAAYSGIAAAFRKAKKFIYLTISFGDEDFLPVPETGETFFDILRACANEGVEVRMVVWQPAFHIPETIPDPSPGMIPGVDEGAPGSIQARWDRAPGFQGRYASVHNLFRIKYIDFSAEFGCHHQKAYVMDDGEGGCTAFVGGINPVQTHWDTPAHDVLDVRRVEYKYPYPLKWLEKHPPLHDIFYRIRGPAAGDVIANFVERYNHATIPHADATCFVSVPAAAERISPVPGGIEVQALRTIASNTYPGTPEGDRGIREFYLNALGSAGEGSLVYIENQYFFDNGVISEIHEAAERGAKIIALLTSNPDGGSFQGRVEKEWEKISYLWEQSKMVEGHRNVSLLTLGNARDDPRTWGKLIYSEIYIHSKTLAVLSPDWAIMTGGSANIAFTSMWFHSEMNIAFMDKVLIRKWVAELWQEHLQVPEKTASGLIDKPDDALAFFRSQADRNLKAMKRGEKPEGRVYGWKDADFAAPDLSGIDLDEVHTGG